MVQRSKDGNNASERAPARETERERGIDSHSAAIVVGRAAPRSPRLVRCVARLRRRRAQDGFASGLLLQLADALRSALPRLTDGGRMALTQLWAYK